MNTAAKIAILLCSTFVCSCERRAHGSKIYRNFDPVAVVGDIGSMKNFNFRLIAEKEEKWDGDYYAISWRFHTYSDVENLMKIVRDVCDLFEKNMRDMGAVTLVSDGVSGSFISQRILNYSIDKRIGGIIIEATKSWNGTDFYIQLREAEQAVASDGQPLPCSVTTADSTAPADAH